MALNEEQVRNRKIWDFEWRKGFRTGLAIGLGIATILFFSALPTG